MRESIRNSLRARYDYQGGYCGVKEVEVGAELTIDHFQPRSHNGSDERDNLVYCCNACNQYKGDYWQPESVERVLHPLHDNMTEHLIELNNGNLQALTETGAFHLSHLHLNRAALIANRKRKRRDAREEAEKQTMLQTMQDLTQELENLKAEIRRTASQENL